jgi:hypothetical protein
MAGGLELLLAGSMRIFGIAKRRPSAKVAGSAISLALDTRQTVGDALGLLHSRRFSCAPTISGLPLRADAGTWVGFVAFGPEAVSLELSKFFRSTTERRHAISLVRIVAIALYPLIQGSESGSRVRLVCPFHDTKMFPTRNGGGMLSAAG